MKFRDIKTKTKLYGGFFSMIMIILIIGIISFLGIQNIGKSFKYVGQKTIKGVGFISIMEADLEKLMSGYYRLLDPLLNQEDRQEILSEIAEFRKSYRKAVEDYSSLSLTAEEERVFQQFLSEVDAWRLVNTQKIDPVHNEFLQKDLLNPIQLKQELLSISNVLKEVRLNSQTNSDISEYRKMSESLHFRFIDEFETGNSIVSPLLTALKNQVHVFDGAFKEYILNIEQGRRNDASRIYNNVMVPEMEKINQTLLLIVPEVDESIALYNQLNHLMVNESGVLHKKTRATLAQMVGMSIEASDEQLRKGDMIAISSNSSLMVAIVIGVVLALVLSYIITKVITNGLRRGGLLAELVSKGDLTVTFDNDLMVQKDEIGDLARSLQFMVNKLRDVITNVNVGAENIVVASEQMNTASQQMAQGANEQASSAEEVSASMEEMAANISQNTHNAKETERIAIGVSLGIKNVSVSASESLNSIRNIADKISIISEISRQTNILALNAAVEAANAGIHGKGFAVVAAEVRKLAETSKIAADEIVQLASKSVDVTEKAGLLMAQLIPEVEKTALLVQEIASASIEQNSGANQVNSAIQQLNQVTQQNASSSETLATSSEELSSQAEQMKDHISFFKVN